MIHFDKIILLFLTVIISLCELCAQSCLKYFRINNQQLHYFIYAILFYAFICYLLCKSYKYQGIGIVNVIWSGVSILIILLGGIVFFGEKITALDKFGVVLVVIGIACILCEGDHTIDNFTSAIASK